MATAIQRTLCLKCNKERKAILKCEGCSQAFCYNHYGDHRQELNKQMENVVIICDTIRQTITEQTDKLQKHVLIQEIDKWENDSINKIRETANEARELLLKYIPEHIVKKEVQLNKLINLIKETRQKNDFIETDLNEWIEELTQLKQQIVNRENIKIRQDSISLVNKIHVDIFGKFIALLTMNEEK